MKKLLYKLKFNKKLVFFLLGLIAIGFLFGTIFITMINSSDKTLVKDYITKYITNINNVNYSKSLQNSLTNNLGFIFIIWLLGISVIGIPIILFILFSKAFTLGFSISSFILNYKTKGCLYALIYIFPSQIINMIMYLILTLYSISFSFKIIYSVINKSSLNFKNMTGKYLKILIISIVICSLCSLYDVFIIPNILKRFV